MNSASNACIRLALLCALLPAATLGCGCGTPLPQDPFDPLGAWHQRHLDCGIPPFAYRLPQEAQAKIHAIWIKYEAGDDCEEEQRATQEVISNIPDEARMRAFKGVCGPGFLANASESVRNAFHNVWFDDSLNVDEKEVEFVKLAAQHLSGTQLPKFEKFKSNLDEAKKRREEMIHGFSQSAREAYLKWNSLRKQERAFLTTLPMDIRVELGLVCKCCGGCTAPNANDSNKPPLVAAHHRARRYALVQASVNALAGALERADRQILAEAAGAECQF